MSAAVIIPALIGAGSAAASTVGAVKSANASRDAATMQSNAADQAMQYSRGNTDRTLAYLMQQQGGIINPMQTSPAYARMAQGLGFGAPVQAGRGQPPAASSGGTVTLQAPQGGQTRQFRVGDPAIEHYLAQGARRV